MPNDFYVQKSFMKRKVFDAAEHEAIYVNGKRRKVDQLEDEGMTISGTHNDTKESESLLPAAALLPFEKQQYVQKIVADQECKGTEVDNNKTDSAHMDFESVAICKESTDSSCLSPTVEMNQSPSNARESSETRRQFYWSGSDCPRLLEQTMNNRKMPFVCCLFPYHSEFY